MGLLRSVLHWLFRKDTPEEAAARERRRANQMTALAMWEIYDSWGSKKR